MESADETKAVTLSPVDNALADHAGADDDDDAPDAVEAPEIAPGERANEESSMAIESQFRQALDDLMKLVDSIIGVDSIDEDNLDDKDCSSQDFSNVHSKSFEVFQLLMEFGESIELGLTPKLSPSGDEEGSVQELTDDIREHLRGTGMKLWMIMRANPKVFSDRGTLRQTPMNSSTSCSNLEENEASQDKAAASGYIRAIAARLVLIHHIHTHGRSIPTLVLSETNGPSLKTDEAVSVPTASHRELEFGVKCFARSGRALLVHGNCSFAAISSLRLCTTFWEGLEAAVENESNDQSTYLAVLKKNIDEVFDAFELLPEAVSLNCDSNSRKRSQVADFYVEKQTAYGSPENILRHLQSLESFVGRYCTEKSTSGSTDECDSESQMPLVSPILATQRYLPALARSGYKHGKRFCVDKKYSSARVALRVSLVATNKCIADIRAQEKKRDDSVSCLSSSMRSQEKEMISVSKECFFLLSHIQLATGKSEEAHKCLDQLEKYIDDQVRHDEETYNSMMAKLRATQDSDQEHLVIEGPRQQDIADIKARAHAGKAEAKHAEATERSQLAFSRIMIDHKSLPYPSQEEERNIDEALAKLAALSKKFFGTVDTSALSLHAPDLSSCESDSLKLAIKAASAILIRRVVRSGELGDIDGLKANKPFDILLEVYGDSHPMYSFILLENLNATIICIESSYNKTPCLEKKVLLAFDDLGKNTASKLIANIGQRSERNVQESNSTLFPKPSGQPACFIRDVERQFARALSFYRDRSSPALCIFWADCFLYVLKHFADEGSVLIPSGNDMVVEDKSKSQLVSDVQGVRAFAMSQVGNDHLLAVEAARDAWERGPTPVNLAVLFHCGAIAEAKASNGDALAELEVSLRRLYEGNDKHMESASVLSIFPVLTHTCEGIESEDGKRLQFGVQKLWIEKLVTIDRITHRDENESPELPLFAILRLHLQIAEDLWDTWHQKKQVESITQNQRQLEATLNEALAFLLRLRDQKSSSKRPEQVDNESQEVNHDADDEASAMDSVSVIWENETIRTWIGEQRECIWISEQLWNLALSPHTSAHVACHLFAKAHDFALLNEEELEGPLTQRHLDIEISDSSTLENQDQYVALISEEKGREACDTSSEFSAQCLILSVAKVIDDMNAKDKNPEDDLLLRRCLVRVLMAKREFSFALEGTSPASYVTALIAWLELQCLIHIGNDEFCKEFLFDEGVLSALSSVKTLSSPNDAVACSPEDELKSSEDASSASKNDKVILDSCTTTGYVFATSLVAKLKCLPQTERCLLQFCADEMLLREAFLIETCDRELHSLGEIQRNLVDLSTNVDDALSTFSSVDGTVKKYGVEIDHKAASSYSTGELDWFAIEAYNRGTNLLLLGDEGNARTLFVVSLNLLPHCGKEVQSYGEDIRKAYKALVDRKAELGATPSVCGALVFSHFGSNADQQG